MKDNYSNYKKLIIDIENSLTDMFIYFDLQLFFYLYTVSDGDTQNKSTLNF